MKSKRAVPSRWPFFVALAGTHAVAAIFAPAAWAPAIAWSVYLPLLPLHAAGMPIFATAASGGWASPSLLGWTVVLLLWLAIWWGAAGLLSRLLAKR